MKIKWRRDKNEPGPEATDGQTLGAWQTWVGPTCAGALVTTGPAVASYCLAKLSDGWTAGVWLTSAVVATLLGLGLGAYLQNRIVRTVNSAGASRTEFIDALSSLHAAMATLLQSDQREPDRKEFYRSVVNSTSSLFGLKGVRICVYELDSADENANEPVLRFVAHGGRSEEPRECFTNDTDHGRAAIEIALNSQHRVVNRSTGFKNVERRPGSEWQAFMQVPLRLNGKALGLLSIDTRDDVVFTYDHVAVARTAASFIVAGMMVVKQAAEDTRPELKDVMEQLESLPDEDEDPC